MSAAVILGVFLLISILDSIHFRALLRPAAGASANAAPAYSTQTLSVLDALLAGPRESREKTYSIPLGTHLYSKESLLVDGKTVRDYPRLQFGGAHLGNPDRDWIGDVATRSAGGLAAGAIVAALVWTIVAALRARSARTSVRESFHAIWARATEVPWRRCSLPPRCPIVFTGWVAAL
jgi:peptide/nickel transport system permease protein